MPEGVTISPPRDESDLAQFADLIHDAFAFPREYIPEYYDAAGRENFRLVRRDDRVVAGLAALPMGQFWGERRLAMSGIAVVATAPEARGTGLASRLLKAVLEEQQHLGTPLSVLFPATLPVYRRAGYENAGAAPLLALSTQRIDVSDRTLTLRPATPADEPAIRQLHVDWARRQAGNCDRSEFLWHRVHFLRDEPAQGYVVTDGDRLEGYVFLLSIPADGDRYNLRVTDCVAATPAAARRILTFLGGWRMQRERVFLRAMLSDPLFYHLAEHAVQMHQLGTWMLRIVDVPRALAERGYPRHLTAELHLSVRDEVLPQNAGRFVLHVADGQGRVEPGGHGSFELDVRGLAAMYTSYLRPDGVVAAGLGAGRDADLAIAEALFTGPSPWMRDGF